MSTLRDESNAKNSFSRYLFAGRGGKPLPGAVKLPGDVRNSVKRNLNFGGCMYKHKQGAAEEIQLRRGQAVKGPSLKQSLKQAQESAKRLERANG